MPNYEAHKKIGFIASFLASLLIIAFLYPSIPLSTLQWILLPLVIIFYTNLPDLDHHMGKLRRKTLTLIFSIMLLSSIVILFVHIGVMLVILTITGLLGLSLLRVKHRGPTHTYLFVLIASLPMLLIHWFFFIIAFLVSAMHIFVDRLFSKTKRKAKKFFGFSGKTYNFNFKF